MVKPKKNEDGCNLCCVGDCVERVGCDGFICAIHARKIPAALLVQAYRAQGTERFEAVLDTLSAIALGGFPDVAVKTTG